EEERRNIPPTFSPTLKLNPKPSQPPSPSLIAELFSSGTGCCRRRRGQSVGAVALFSSHRRTLLSSHRSSSRHRALSLCPRPASLFELS
ncbi:hypothetical protein S245_056750, partial [Arachis hypogaea]